jgi:hypothetical protein
MKSKLLLLCLVLSGTYALQAQPKFIDNRLGYLYAMKIFHINPADEQNRPWVDDYLQSFDPGNYGKSRNNEFEREGVIASTIALLQKAIDSVQFDTTTYTIEAEGLLGQYDFTRKGFPLVTSSLPTTGRIGFMHFIQHSKLTVTWTRQVEIAMYNDHQLGFLPMDPDSAKEFIASRTSLNGYIDRTFFALVHFRLLPEGLHVVNEFGQHYSWNAQGQIKEVVCFRSKYDRLRLGVIRPDSLPENPVQPALAGIWVNEKTNERITISPAQNSAVAYEWKQPDGATRIYYNRTLGGYLNANGNDEIFLLDPRHMELIDSKETRRYYRL